MMKAAEDAARRAEEALKKAAEDAALRAAEEERRRQWGKVERFMAAEFGEGWGTVPVDAVREGEPLARQGEANAQFLLGRARLAEHPEEAAGWFRQAAEQGHADGQKVMGLLHATGIGVEKDETAAKEWFRRAAAQGEATALYRLEAMEAESKRRTAVCDAFRSSDIELGGEFCLVNRKTAEEEHPKRDQAVALANKLSGVFLFEDDVLFWNVPAHSAWSTFLVTARELVCLDGETISRRAWKDIRRIDWKHTPNGKIDIDGGMCVIGGDCRRGIVEALQSVLRQERADGEYGEAPNREDTASALAASAERGGADAQRQAQYRLDAKAADASARGAVCDAFRSSGIELGEEYCLVNRHTAEEQHPKRDQAVAAVNQLSGVFLLKDEVLFWDAPPKSDRAVLLVTAKGLFYLEGESVWQWDWKDIREIDWERKTNGSIVINGTACMAVMDYRKNFVEAVRHVLRSIR